MRDFQWVVTDFLLQHLQGKLIALLAGLIAVIVITAILVGRELRKDRQDSHADQ